MQNDHPLNTLNRILSDDFIQAKALDADTVEVPVGLIRTVFRALDDMSPKAAMRESAVPSSRTFPRETIPNP